MQLRSDDPVYRVDNRFLGPQGITLAKVGVRYQAIGVGFLVWVPIVLALRWMSIGGLGGLVASLAVTILVTVLVMQIVDHDRPLTAQLTVLLHEITAPRPPQAATAATLSPAAVSVTRPRRPHSWWRRRQEQ